MGKNQTIFQKIFKNSVVLVMLALLFYNVFNLYYEHKKIMENTMAEVSALSVNINSTLREYMVQAEGTISSIYYELYQNKSGALSKFLQKSEETEIEERLNQSRELNHFFSQLFLMRRDFVDAYIFMDNNRYFIYSMYGGEAMGHSPLNEEWYLNTIEKNGKTQAIINEIPAQIKYTKPVVGVARKIKNIDNEQIAENIVIRLDFTMENLDKLIGVYALSENTIVLLVDENNEIVYQRGAEVNFASEKEKENFLMIDGNARIYSGGKEKYIVAASEVELYEWKAIIAVNTKQISNLTREYISMEIAILLMLILMAIVFAFFYARSMTRPIKELEEGIKLVQTGEFDIILQKTTNDELGRLIEMFNIMSGKIKKLIREKYEEELQKKEAQYRFLQAQMDPHFIFNTLQIISSMAVVKNVLEIENVSNNLARMMRYSIQSDKKTILLKEELKNVESYMEIQKVRFKKRLSYDIIVNMSLDGIYIVKFVLQPIVENAINHGIEMKEYGGSIKIDIDERDDIFVEISDNGVGMEEEELTWLIMSINQKASKGDDNATVIAENVLKEKGNHVGLYNINQRLKLCYGEKYGLCIQSTKNIGTKVIVRIPKCGEER